MSKDSHCQSATLRYGAGVCAEGRTEALGRLCESVHTSNVRRALRRKMIFYGDGVTGRREEKCATYRITEVLPYTAGANAEG